MFYNCTNLTNAPVMSAISIDFNSSMQQMFHGCSKLSSIDVNFTSWPSNAYALYNWVGGVAATGIFYKPAELSTEFADNRIPNGWTVKNKL